MTKKYYWIKLKTDFFDTDKIDFLLSQENGCEYVVLYQMLCTKTANTNGMLATQMGEVIIPYDINKIARDSKYFSVDTIIVALELYKKLGLIYENNEGNLMIANYGDMVGSETSSAKAMREWRNKKKLQSKSQCDNNVTQEIDIDIRDKEIENRDKDIEKDIPAPNDLKNHSVPAIIELPLNDKTLFPLFTDNIKEYEELYPAVDVLQELRKMKGWLNANPTKRKTKRGIARFINSWLSREQDKGHYASQKEHRNTDFDEFE